MTEYPWYCPECGPADYGYPEDDAEAPRCKQCGGEMCRLEPDSGEEKDSAASDEVDK